MSLPLAPFDAMTRAARPLRGHTLLLGALAVIACGIAVAAEGQAALFFLATASTLALLAMAILAFAAGGGLRQRRQMAAAEAILAADPVPSFIGDPEGRVLYRNPAAIARFGATEGGVREGLGHVFADPVAAMRPLQARALRQGAAWEDVAIPGGQIRLSAHRLAGAAVLWRVVEVAERASRNAAGQGMVLPVIVADAGGAVLSRNEAMRALLGGSPRHLDRILSEPAVRSGEVMRILTGEGPRDMLVVESPMSGARREICFLPSQDSAGESDRERGSFDDIPVALLWIAADGQVLSANRAAREMLCFEAEAVFGDLVSGLGRPVGDWLSDAMQGRGLDRPEILRASRREEEFYVQTVLRRVVTRGRPQIVAVLNDATEHRNLQSQFFQSQKMQAIGQFAGGIAHDFNNLLTAISGHCDLLLLRHDRRDPEFADLEQIRQNSERAAGLVGQLLAFSRKQTMMAEVIDLRDTLSDLTHLLNRLVGERVRLVFSHDETLRTVRADRRQIEQVMMNLVVNARDAMPKGGTIRITTEEVHLAEPLRRDRAEVPVGHYAVVRVGDEGIGIPPERLTQIFEPFFTTKRVGEGTGLGLSTVYGIVKQSGGFIFVDSVVAAGTTFAVYLPIHVPLPSESAAAPVIVAARPPPAREKDGVVLLVEDEAPVRAFAARALRLRGYTVLEAENAEQALLLLEDAALTVDVFVTDVIMPGMDGPTWVREALKTRPGVRVVFVSGYAEESFAEAQSRIPLSVFLPKPFSLSQLTTTVEEQLH